MAALALTYALAVFEERECPVPRVQMHPDDRALAKPRGEVCLVTLVMQQSLKQHTLHSIESLRSTDSPQFSHASLQAPSGTACQCLPKPSVP